MGIILITVKGDSKRVFANALHEKTGGAVDFVIMQKPEQLSLFKRVLRLYKRVGLLNFPRELWYGLLLRINGAKSALEYFREYTKSDFAEFVPKVMEVDSINSDEVFDLFKKTAPDLIVIWGGTILKPRILGTAPKAINLHMGYCPHYSGALANQCAMLEGDLDRIGATIHYAENKADSGDILALVTADMKKPPREMFRDLNDRALVLYVDIASRIFRGEEIEAKPQDISQTKNLLLRQWVPSTRYKVGKKILDLEGKFGSGS